MSNWKCMIFGHDWEIVETSRHYFQNGITFFYSSKTNNPFSTFFEKVHNKVCVRCGECHNGIQEAVEGHDKQKVETAKKKKIADKRKALAKDVYKMNCESSRSENERR